MKISSSEPKVLVLGGNSERWSARDIPNTKNTMNGIEAWAFAFWGDYRGYRVAKASEISQYDIVIANTNIGCFPQYFKFRDKLRADAKWIALIEGQAADYLVPSTIVKQALDAADVVNCINRFSLYLLRSITSARVEYLGIPYPAATIRKHSVPIRDRKKEVLICPPLTARWNDYFVARELGLDYYGFERKLSRKLNTLWQNYAHYNSFVNKEAVISKVRSIYKDPNLRIEPMTHLENIFKITGQSFLWLNLDDRYTWGRNVLDAAALQIPVITTRSTGHAEDFFPLTTVNDEFDMENAIQIGKRLITDEEFYRSVTDIPLETFDHLSHESMKNTLLSWI